MVPLVFSNPQCSLPYLCVIPSLLDLVAYSFCRSLPTSSVLPVAFTFSVQFHNIRNKKKKIINFLTRSTQWTLKLVLPLAPPTLLTTRIRQQMTGRTPSGTAAVPSKQVRRLSSLSSAEWIVTQQWEFFFSSMRMLLPLLALRPHPSPTREPGRH